MIVPKMTPDELAEFLAVDRNAVIATVGADGLPQQTPVWFVYEDDTFYVSAQETTVKVRNLRDNPAVSICVDAGREAAQYVVASGQAQLIAAGDPFQLEMRCQIVRKYHTHQEAADRYIASIEHTSSALIVLKPERIVTATPG
ncbi:TIGR03618 family F420-dependent PPOX class oxidoreductase [bacterium]|nr:TIGR03618 family F420-dependent PPOX class oxidoreductase [bacterium]